MLLALRGQPLVLPAQALMYPKREALDWRLRHLR